MCGFVGFTNTINNYDNVLEKMCERIRHRGPDSGGKYTDNDICLGFRRLSIIDLEGGSQPIYNEDNTKVLIFNGEIYNYKDLRKELIACGHIFTTNTDSETLLHGYEQWGEKLLERLRGMFAFVIWDKIKKELFIARDFFGIKPMYFGLFGKTLMFASEIKAFLEHPDFNKELNTDVLEQYLTFQYSPTKDTFFKNVYKLLPAHYLKYSNGKLDIQRYWEVKFDPKEQTLEHYVDEIESIFKDSVAAHKISDVEVGSFLSSGIDSSYVAAMADVDKTFTVGFMPPNMAAGDDPNRYNEIGYAKEFSEYIKKENYSKTITPEEYWDNFSKIQYHLDEPLADPSAVALYFVCSIAAKKLKVVLSGEGADEIFGGYNVYSDPNGTLYDRIPFFVRRNVGNIAKKMPAKKGRNFLVRKGQTLEERFIGNAYIFSPEERKELLKIKTNAIMPQEVTKQYYRKSKEYDEVTRMQYLDLHLWMAGDILLKADKMSMAHSLELRVPFLDRRVFDVAKHIPTKYRVTRKATDEAKLPYITKYALRLAAKRNIPPKSAAKKKLGFPVPIRVWLKEDEYFNKVKNQFTSPIAEKFFNTDKLILLLENHRCNKADNSRKIWTVYTFLVWYDVFMR
ncbi:MAG: asparagine synthase (glutamine-hydrolyzing) [Oscillospiraceae bacterium]|nr:asparagine synthase (glutamine-hydrolyzing) [Oscillospiraceae bacterium]